jgi:hypothetical protein
MILEDVGWGEGIGFPNKWPEFNRGNAIVKAERYSPWLGEMLDSGEAVGLSIHRDPRQVALSLLNYYTARAIYLGDILPTWEEDILEQWLPLAIQWHDKWTEHGVYSIPYEAYYDAPSMVAHTCAKALNIDISDSDYYKIDAAFGVGSQLIRLRKQDKWLDNSDTLLTKGHISSTVGSESWQSRLTLKQVFDVQSMPSIKEWMERWGYCPVDFMCDPSTPYVWDGISGEDKELWNG